MKTGGALAEGARQGTLMSISKRSDADMGLQMLRFWRFAPVVQPVYGAGSKYLGKFSAVGGHANLFFVPDPVLSLQEVGLALFAT